MENANASIEEEIDCMRNIVECLTASLDVINKFAKSLESNAISTSFSASENEDDIYADLDLKGKRRSKSQRTPSKINFNQQFTSDILPAIDQSLECFQLSLTLLASDTYPMRIKTLLFDNNPDFIRSLLEFVAIPIPLKLGSRQEESFSSKNSDMILNLKVYALKTLTKIISICSYEAANCYENEEEESKEITKLCAESIVEDNGLEILLRPLEMEEDDSLRLAITETLFFFVVRNEMGRLALMIQHGLRVFISCLNYENSPVIRSYYCAILREFAAVYPEELLKENIIGITCKLMNIDPSPEVRALCAEILEVIFRNDPRAMKFIDGVPTQSNQNFTIQIDIAKVLSNRLMKDESREVLEATCKLLETLFCLRNKKFLNDFIRIGGWRAFIRCLKNCSIRPASLAVRALRYLVQTADYSEQLGLKIITHFPSLSVLLKSSLEQDIKKESIAHKLLRVELAICLSLIFAQNPQCRRHVHQELKAFPLWMSTLRSALLSHLSHAEIEYFSDVALVDASGVNLIQAFNTTDVNQKQAMQQLFSEQEFRMQDTSAVSSSESESSETQSRRFSINTNSEIRSEASLGRLKSLILSFAIHLTLSPREQVANELKPTSNVYENDNPRPNYFDEVNDDEVGTGDQSVDSVAIQPKKSIDKYLNKSSKQETALDQDLTPSSDEKSTFFYDSTLRSTNSVLTEKQKQLAKIRQQQQRLREQEESIKKEAEEELEKLRNSQRYDVSGHDDLPNVDNVYVNEATQNSGYSHLIEPRPQIPFDHYGDGNSYAPGEFYHGHCYCYPIKEDNIESQSEHLFVENHINRLERYKFKEGKTTDGFEINPSQHSMQIAAAHKKKLMSQASIQNRRFQLALSICKRFASWYMDPSVRKRKEQTQRQAMQTMQQGVATPPNSKKGAMQNLLKNYISTGDGLVMRRTSAVNQLTESLSPQKLQRSWSDEDARESDLFEIDIQFDDFRVEAMEQVLQKMKRHHKLIKKMFITCPQGINARGRRTFLLDMNMNIMPRMCQSVQELIRLAKENGEERIKMPIYLWKGKDRRDKSITNYNILEIIEYIKMYLANSADNHQQYIAENEYAEHVEEMLQEEEVELLEKQEQIAKREMNAFLESSQVAASTRSSDPNIHTEQSKPDRKLDEEMNNSTGDQQNDFSKSRTNDQHLPEGNEDLSSPGVRRMSDKKRTPRVNHETLNREPSNRVEESELVLIPQPKEEIAH